MSSESAYSDKFRFEAGGYDVRCRHCGTGFYVVWLTDRGDPVNGDHCGECEECEHVVEFKCRYLPQYIQPQTED